MFLSLPFAEAFPFYFIQSLSVEVLILMLLRGAAWMGDEYAPSLTKLV
jgi:hypothetical protein